MSVSRIQHNIASMNAYRNYSANSSKLSKNLEKLASGYRINRAGDDAAGLAISEKMRVQISGLTAAEKNAKDGISLIQTAEGALTEVHDMLNRMVTLTEQSANGTYQNELDREQLQKEIESLKTEIDRIADSTNFNGQKLLDGSLDSTTTTTDTTKWTSVKENLLPDVTVGEVGTGTIVHKGENVEATPGEFSVTLNNFAPKFSMANADTNEDDTVSITIGLGAGTSGSEEAGNVSQVLTVTAKEVAAEEGSSITERVAKAFVTKYGEGGSAISQNEKLGIDVFKGADDSQHFDISLGENGTLKFTQTNAPESEDQVVGTDLQVKIESTNKAGDAAEGAAAGDLVSGAIEVKITATGDDKDKLIEALDDGGEFTITLTDKLPSSPATTDIDANTKTFEYGIDDGDELEFSGLTAPEGYEIQYKTADDQWTTLADNGKITLKDTTSNAAELAIDAADGAKIPDIEFRIVETGNTGDDDTPLATFTLNTSAYVNAEPGKTVGLSDSAPTDTVTKASTITLTATHEDGNGASDYNAATTVIKEPTVSSAASLASTYLKGSDLREKIADGSQIKLGDDVYTFALGSESTVDKSGKNVVDLTDLTVTSNGQIAADDQDGMNTALARLTKAAEANGMYSVGYDITSDDAVTDKGHLTLTENKSYSGGADLSTRAAIAATIQFSEGATSETTAATEGGKALTLQIGDTSEEFNKMSVNVKDMHAASLGIADIDISSQEGAASALDKIKSAVNMVSDVRGSLGAMQNRLDHTINNLGVMRENIQNAEGLIRDTDVAEEMMTYTKNSILNQSAQAMLAQANQLPQGVLQLLG